MKLRQLFIFSFFFIATLLITIFVFDLLTNLDTENLPTVITQNTNVVINNQFSTRDVKSVTNTITSNVTLPTSNEEVIKNPGLIKFKLKNGTIF